MRYKYVCTRIKSKESQNSENYVSSFFYIFSSVKDPFTGELPPPALTPLVTMTDILNMSSKAGAGVLVVVAIMLWVSSEVLVNNLEPVYSKELITQGSTALTTNNYSETNTAVRFTVVMIGIKTDDEPGCLSDTVP